MAFQFAFAGDDFRDEGAILASFEHHAVSIGKMNDIDVERQAQHRPYRVSKLRTRSVGTDPLGRIRKPLRRPVRRKAGSVQKPGGRWKDIP